MTYKFNKSILRAYDIRGITGETLSLKDAFYLGKSFGSYLESGAKICVAFDGRHSSPALEEELVKGLLSTGAEVIRVGRGPTPMLYFSVKYLKADGGIMITGSHNPPDHNGFKMMLAALPLHGDQILELGKIAEDGAFKNGSGSVSFEDVKSDYLSHLLSAVKDGEELKIAWDAGNGAAGEMMKDLTDKLPGTHILLNEKIDGDFPAHHPDPSVEENMQQLIAVVKGENCDLGIAFDGDGDRIGVVDAAGKMIFGDQLMVLYARDILKEHPGGKIIADVKASQVLFDDIKAHGGVPIIYKCGHSLIKTKMHEVGAPFAGEMSGHVFFADNFGFDDGLYAAIKLINILANSAEKIGDIIDNLPKTYSTPEIRFEVDEARKFAIVEAVKEDLQSENAEISDIDGVRVLSKDGWWLLRASNTQAVLVARCESESEAGLEKLKKHLSGILAKNAVEIDF